MHTRQQEDCLWDTGEMYAVIRNCLLACCLALPPAAYSTETPAPLRLLVGEVPPYAIPAGVPGPGALVEITQELAKRVGVTVEVEFYPWTRALVTAALKPRTLVLPVTRTEEREARYRWMVKLVRQRLVFVGLQGKRDLSDSAALKQARVAVLRGTPYKRMLLDAGFTDVAECSTIRECLRMVRSGIADASFGAEDAQRAAAQGDGKHGDIEFSPPFQQNDVWLAGSTDISEDEARKWHAAMEALRADGTVSRILRKYGATAN